MNCISSILTRFFVSIHLYLLHFFGMNVAKFHAIRYLIAINEFPLIDSCSTHLNAYHCELKISFQDLVFANVSKAAKSLNE